MTDTEDRAVIEFHAKKLLGLNEERFPGSGVLKKEKILEILARMTELAKELSE